MKITIWGAGDVGRMVAYRFAMLEFVSEIAWINRSIENMEGRRIDLDQGLAFAPACRSVTTFSQERASMALDGTDILILTLGGKVPPEGEREALYPDNSAIYRKTICSALQGFGGSVIVVTNPVDLLARLVQVETNIPAARVLGLGTVVETARMQTALRDYLCGTESARDIQAYAIGTHDLHFVPVIPEHCFLGERLKPRVLDSAVEMTKTAVARAAERVKHDGVSTLHPIIEGIVAVARAMANDTRTILTVSTLDPDDPDRLFYSLPCAIGKDGVVRRHTQILESPGIKAKLQIGLDAMRAALQRATTM